MPPEVQGVGMGQRQQIRQFMAEAESRHLSAGRAHARAGHYAIQDRL